MHAVSRRQTTASKDSTEAESKAYAHASEATVGLADLLAEILEVFWAPTPIRGDCRASLKIITNGTDRFHHASYKKALAYTEDKVNRALVFLDFLPRQFNIADNLCQEGTPYERWRSRRDQMLGITTNVHVTETIREIQQQHQRLLRRRLVSNTKESAAESISESSSAGGGKM